MLPRSGCLYRLSPSSKAHLILQNFFWSLANSEPYSANSYDLLHSDEGGKFGRHIWPLVLDVLGKNGFKGRLSIKFVIIVSLFSH